MPIAIRRFEPSDQAQVLPLVLSIQREEFGIPVTAEEQPDLRDVASHYIKPGGNFWVAGDQATVVGTIGLLTIGHGDLALRKMFVASGYRGREHGVGLGLLTTAIGWARANGFQRVLLGTTDQFMAAQRFYEKNGFVVIDRDALPDHFPRMRLDTRFYQMTLASTAVE